MMQSLTVSTGPLQFVHPINLGQYTGSPKLVSHAFASAPKSLPPILSLGFLKASFTMTLLR
jgi:hypothetical protein